MTNRGERLFQRDLHWIKRLKKYGAKISDRYSGQWFCIRDQSKPCGCYGCQGESYSTYRAKIKQDNKKTILEQIEN